MRILFPVLLAALASLLFGGEMRRSIEYARPAGVALHLDASLPDHRAAPVPAMILVHGGGWANGDREHGIEPLAGALSAAGVAWFSIDYRLAPDHTYPAAVEDVAAAVEFVAENARTFGTDRDRLFLAGFSAGGHLAALAATTTPAGSKLAGVLSFYGRMDLQRGYATPGPAVAAIRDMLGLAPGASETHPLLRDASPIEQIRPGLPPFLMFHGTADTVVPFDDSRRMCAALRKAGIACGLIPIDGGDHGMSGWGRIEPRPDFTQRVLEWVNAIPAAHSTRP